MQIFQVSIQLHDDWLHRRDALQDMDLLTYAEHIERRRKPIRGDDHANSYTTSDWLGPGNGFENVMQGDHDVLKPHVGRPRCFDTMVQNIILPQIGLGQEMDLKTLCRETTIF